MCVYMLACSEFQNCICTLNVSSLAKALLIVRTVCVEQDIFKYRVSIESVWGRKLALHKCILHNYSHITQITCKFLNCRRGYAVYRQQQKAVENLQRV